MRLTGPHSGECGYEAHPQARMPMRIFLSAGEPSGDLHGANLLRALRRRWPDAQCMGYGGERMAAAGCQLLYPLCDLSVMWFTRVLALAPLFLDLVSRTDRFFRHHRPDLVILIDYPGFNWWVARRAHFHGIPVVYFVPPQLWAWAGWRVHKMRKSVDLVLCSLPFEEEWYLQRMVAAKYVGHPYFDELSGQRLDMAFVARQQGHGATIVGLLPGSRTQEVERNLSTLVQTAGCIAAARPDTRFLVACFKRSHQERIDRYLDGRNLPIETHVGRTPEIIHLSRACVAVSGSVGLELLFHAKPSVVVYGISKWDVQLCRWLKTTPFISLVNLLAEKEIYPEFLTNRCPADAIAGHVLHWLDDPAAYQAIRQELSALRQRVGLPGACDRAVEALDPLLERYQLRTAG